MEIPAVFEQDIQSQSFSIVTRVIIGDTDPIYLSTHNLNFQGNYYKPLLLGIPSMKESVDYESRNFKISNVTLKISNYEHDGERFSDSFRRNPLINQQCEIYWNTQSATSSSDTLRIFKGYVRRINHTDSQVSIQIEDLTEKHLHKTLPIERTSNSHSVDSKYRDVPIPIAFGELLLAPAVLDAGDIVKADSDESISLMTDLDHDIWSNFPTYDSSGATTPLRILDGQILYVPKETNVEIEHEDLALYSPLDYIQYYDEFDANSPVTQSGTIKLNPFTISIKKVFQIYSSAKSQKIKCVKRSSGSSSNLEGISVGGHVQERQEGWNNPDNFTEELTKWMSNLDYTFDTLENINGFEPFHRWDTAEGYSTHMDYIGQTFAHTTNNSAQNLMRVEVDSEPQFDYLALNIKNLQLPRTEIALNRIPIKLHEEHFFGAWYSRSVQIYSRTQTQSNAAALYGGATYPMSPPMMCYLDGWRIADDGSNDIFWQDFRPIFQFLQDGEVDSSSSYRGDGSVMSNKFSTIDVRRITGGTPATGGDYGAFIIIDDVTGTYGTVNITIGDYVAAGNHQVEFEGGIGGDWAEIDLLHTADIEAKRDLDYYLAVIGRKDGGTTLRNPIEILRNLAINELGLSDDDIDTDSYNTAKSIHGTYKFDFSIKDEIGSKELFEEVAKSTLCYPYFNNQGKLTFPSYKPSYSEDDYNNAKVIKDFDVINFSFNRTKLENVYTACRMKYDYDYTTDKYDKILLYNASETSPPNLGIYNMYQNGAELAYNGYSLITDNILEFESPYIKDGQTAGKVWQYMYRDSQFQHLTCKIKLPLKYIHLDVGDYIRFDKLLGGMKAFGIDYTRLVTLITEYANSYVNLIRDGAIYPMFFITSVNKNLDSIEIEARQMHHLDGTDINNLDFWGWDANDMSSVNAEEQDEEEEEELYDDSELEDNEYKIDFNYHNGWHTTFFRTVNSHPSSSLEFWTDPQSFGTGNFMVFVPHPMPPTFNYLDIQNYVIFEFKIATIIAHTLHHVNLRLRNVGGSVADPDSPAYNFELGWTTEIIKWDGTVVLNETQTDDAWAAFFDEDYTVIGDDHPNLTSGGDHLRSHTIELGEGFKEALWRQVFYGEEYFEWNPQYTDLAFRFNSGVDSYEPQYGYGAGDANGDGVVNIQDIVRIVNYVLGTTDLDAQEKAGADANGDGTVNILDVVAIVQYILGQGQLGDD